MVPDATSVQVFDNHTDVWNAISDFITFFTKYRTCLSYIILLSFYIIILSRKEIRLSFKEIRFSFKEIRLSV